MWDHLQCRCGHARMLHGWSAIDRACRLCDRAPERRWPCMRFRWRWLHSSDTR